MLRSTGALALLGLSALTTAEVAGQPTSLRGTFGPPVTIATHAQLAGYGFSFGPSDGQFGAIPAGSGTYTFYGIAGSNASCAGTPSVKQGAFTFSGTLDSVTGSNGCRKLFGPGDGPSGWIFDRDYAGGGKVIPFSSAGKSGWLMPFHAEAHWQNPATSDHKCFVAGSTTSEVPCFYSTLGLAVSTDGAKTFEVAGEILEPSQPMSVFTGGGKNMSVGYGSLVVADSNGRHLDNPPADPTGAYFYLFFADLLPGLPGACATAICTGVARASYADVVTAALSGDPHQVARVFRKYDGASPDPWAQPATSDTPDLSGTAGRYEPLWSDEPSSAEVIYDGAFGVYLALYQSGGAVKVRASNDLIHWSGPIGASYSESGRSLYYPTFLGETGDPTIAGTAPRVFFSSFPTGHFPDYTTSVLESVTLTLSTSGDFSLGTSSGTVAATPGGSTTADVSTTVSGDFDWPIALSATGLPSGVTASFAPSSIAAPGSGSSTLTLYASSGVTPGTYPVTITASGGGTSRTATLQLTLTPPVATPPQLLLLSQSRVQVAVQWQNPYSGQSGTAYPLPQNDQFGFFYYSDPTNPEVFVKVLDFGAGSALCFVGGLTDFYYKVTFTMLRTGQVITFVKPAYQYIGFVDNSTLKFAGVPDTPAGSHAGLSSAIFVGALSTGGTTATTKAVPALPPARATPAPQTAAPQSLVFSSGRVSATVDWRNPYSGESGRAYGIPKADPYGFFYYSDPNNPEVFVKVLDFGSGSALVFVGGLTDFYYKVTFTVLLTGQVLVFEKPEYQYIGFVDNSTLKFLTPASTNLTWVSGSTVKLEQIIGDCDWPDLEQRRVCTPTASQTITKNDVEGTDLGSSFETPTGLMFLFGDTIGVKTNYHAGDFAALSTTTDPEAPLLLNLLTNSDGSTYLIRPPGVVMGADDVPAAGISVNGQIYFLCATGADTSLPNPHVHDQSVLVKFDPATKGITTGRTISSIPGGHFINPALHSSGTDVLMFGVGDYRATDVYLADVPASSFESGSGTRYFAGLVNGQPTWTEQESGAVAIVVDNPLLHTPPDPPTIGNVSVVYSQDLGLWLMTCDGGRQTEATNGIYFSYALNPWGPWSQPQLIFNAKRDHALGVFIHDPSLVPDDLLDGPTIGGANNPPTTTRGGNYAPFLIERFVTVQGQTLKIYYTMATWNPYTVVRMRSEFAINSSP